MAERPKEQPLTEADGYWIADGVDAGPCSHRHGSFETAWRCKETAPARPVFVTEKDCMLIAWGPGRFEIIDKQAVCPECGKPAVYGDCMFPGNVAGFHATAAERAKMEATA